MTVDTLHDSCDRYVLALRKYEGFEMPALEALFCGARPILYDLPSFRWYKGHAAFLNASLSGDALSTAIRDVLYAKPKPVLPKELAALHEAFAWQRIVPRLFERVERALAAVKGAASTPSV